MVDQHLDGGAVFAAIGDDDIGVALAGLHKSLVHGLDGGAVLGDDTVQGAAPLLDIPQDAAEDPLVSVGVYIDLVIEQAAQLRLRMPSTMRTGAGSICCTSLLRLWLA